MSAASSLVGGGPNTLGFPAKAANALTGAGDEAGVCPNSGFVPKKLDLPKIGSASVVLGVVLAAASSFWGVVGAGDCGAKAFAMVVPSFV